MTATKPEDQQALLQLIDDHIANWRYADAGDLLERTMSVQGMERSPFLAQLQLRMARMAGMAGDRLLELQWLQVAYDTDPRDEGVAAELENLARLLGKDDVVARVSQPPPAEGESSLEVDVSDHDALLIDVDERIESGQWADVGLILEQAIKAHGKARSPELAQLQHRMARLAAASDDQALQLEWLEAALDTDRNNSEIAAELAELAFEIGDQLMVQRTMQLASISQMNDGLNKARLILVQAKMAEEGGDKGRARMLERRASEACPELADSEKPAEPAVDVSEAAIAEPAADAPEATASNLGRTVVDPQEPEPDYAVLEFDFGPPSADESRDSVDSAPSVVQRPAELLESSPPRMDLGRTAVDPLRDEKKHEPVRPLPPSMPFEHSSTIPEPIPAPLVSPPAQPKADPPLPAPEPMAPRPKVEPACSGHVSPDDGGGAIDDVNLTDLEEVVAYVDDMLDGGRASQANDLLDRAIEKQGTRRSPKMGAVLFRKARLAGSAGDKSQQLEWLNKAFGYDRRNGEVVADLAELAFEMGDLDRALTALRTITVSSIESRLSRPHALLMQARIAHQRGETTRAMAWASRAKQEDPSLDEAAELLGLLRKR